MAVAWAGHLVAPMGDRKVVSTAVLMVAWWVRRRGPMSVECWALSMVKSTGHAMDGPSADLMEALSVEPTAAISAAWMVVKMDCKKVEQKAEDLGVWMAY